MAREVLSKASLRQAGQFGNSDRPKSSDERCGERGAGGDTGPICFWGDTDTAAWFSQAKMLADHAAPIPANRRSLRVGVPGTILRNPSCCCESKLISFLVLEHRGRYDHHRENDRLGTGLQYSYPVRMRHSTARPKHVA